MGWVGWADEFLDGAVAGVEKEGGVKPVPSAGFVGVDEHGESYAKWKIQPTVVREGPLFNAGGRTEGSGLESQAADDSKPTCCCGECMRLEYVDLGWEAAHGVVPGEGRKKWYWTCARGGCAKFVWVEETGGLTLDEEVGSQERPETSVRILW